MPPVDQPTPGHTLTFLVVLYALAGLVNLGIAVAIGRRRANRRKATISGPATPGSAAAGPALGRLVIPAVASAIFSILALAAGLGYPLGLPLWLRDGIDAACNPLTLYLAALVTLIVAWYARRWLVRPMVGLTFLNLAIIWLGASLLDPDFAAEVGRPDNVAVVGMLLLMAGCLWAAAHSAVENDRRLTVHQPPVEAEDNQRVLVWPDLVAIELVATLLIGAGLIAWSLLLAAPLEGPANPAVTPNPAKAPWYFLGLQELLVFADAWNAGVMVPLLAVVGLMLLPYLDVNPRGSGYYTMAERRFAVTVFLLGFFLLGVLPIVVGTFLRGPNWVFYGPYETRDPYRLAEALNVSLAEYFWTFGLGVELPRVDAVGGWHRVARLLYRELPGLILLVLYFIALPVVLRYTALKEWRRRMGGWRFAVMMFLLLWMASLPLKMVLRWTFQLSYIVHLPEWSLSF